MYTKPRDPRAVSEQGLLRRWPVRRRSGVARVFRQARVRSCRCPEAALLAGLVKSPSSYAPTVSLERATVASKRRAAGDARDRRNRSRRTGRRRAPLAVVLHDNLRAGRAARSVLQGAGAASSWSIASAGSACTKVACGSFRPSTCRAQRGGRWPRAEDARAAAGRRLDAPAAKATDDVPAASGRRSIAMDPQTGPRPRDGRRTRLRRRAISTARCRRDRQPGSAFKPFVYAAALEAGYTPATVIDHLNDPIETPQGAGRRRTSIRRPTSMSLRTGLRTSSNRAAVRLLQQVGIPQTVQYAKTTWASATCRACRRSRSAPARSRSQSLTAAYAAFANGGRVPRPLLIRRVEDTDGHVLYAADDVAGAPSARRPRF